MGAETVTHVSAHEAGVRGREKPGLASSRIDRRHHPNGTSRFVCFRLEESTQLSLFQVLPPVLVVSDLRISLAAMKSVLRVGTQWTVVRIAMEQ